MIYLEYSIYVSISTFYPFMQLRLMKTQIIKVLNVFNTRTQISGLACDVFMVQIFHTLCAYFSSFPNDAATINITYGNGYVIPRTRTLWLFWHWFLAPLDVPQLNWHREHNLTQFLPHDVQELLDCFFSVMLNEVRKIALEQVILRALCWHQIILQWNYGSA